MKKQLFSRLTALTLAASALSGCTVSLDDGEIIEDDLQQEDSEISLEAIEVITDIQLRASSSSTPPPGPSGYQLVGYWDVDAGGSLGTNGSTGTYMMAMYARYRSTDHTTTCVEEVLMVASNQSSLPPSVSPGFSSRGYWDVDSGGAVGGSGASGSYMMGLYTRSGSVSNGSCLQAAELAASSSSQPPCVPGYDCAGWWDVDDGGSRGTYGSSGSYMMAFSTLTQ